MVYCMIDLLSNSLGAMFLLSVLVAMDILVQLR